MQCSICSTALRMSAMLLDVPIALIHVSRLFARAGDERLLTMVWVLYAQVGLVTWRVYVTLEQIRWTECPTSKKCSKISYLRSSKLAKNSNKMVTYFTYGNTGSWKYFSSYSMRFGLGWTIAVASIASITFTSSLKRFILKIISNQSNFTRRHDYKLKYV